MAVVGLLILGLLLSAGGPATSNSYSARPSTTEEKLKSIYDAQGTAYDAEMIRDDARAADQLAREQGMTTDEMAVLWSTQR